MRIGILTFSRTHNFGAILQCFALQNVLESFGHEVIVVDYKQPYIEATNRPFLWSVFFSKIKNFKSLLRYLHSINRRKQTENRFEEFKTKYLNCSASCTEKNLYSEVDAYIVGSDQVWSSKCTCGYDPVFWGIFKRKSGIRLFSYAISADQKSIDSVPEELLDNIKREFFNLSFREKNIASLIQCKSKVNVNINIDPTLLLSQDSWNKMINSHIMTSDNYVLIYEARKLKSNKNALLEYGNTIAEDLKCKVIYLTYDYSPVDFVSFFKYARYVITSSFHGTVFGLIFNKPMSVICLNDGHDARYIDLLNKVGANNALVPVGSKLSLSGIDYNTVNKKLQVLRNESIDYLKNLLR